MREALGTVTFLVTLVLVLVVGWLVFKVGYVPAAERVVAPISVPAIDQVQDRMLDCLARGYDWNGYAQTCDYAGTQP
jgi:hypothetical protein